MRAYFDVGNVVLYGYPQDWIRTLGKRIVKLHIKDFSFTREPGTDKSVAASVPWGEGILIGQPCMRRFMTLAIKVRQPWSWIRRSSLLERDTPALRTDPHRGDAEEG